MLLFLSLLLSFAGVAQPTLPDMEAHKQAANIVLSWNCQYEKLKSVRIRRSDDSVTGFQVIGELFNQKRGVQSFTDTAPLHGDSYYKLMITFASGLNWSSNTIHTYFAGKPVVTGPVADTNRPASIHKISVADPVPGTLNGGAFPVSQGPKALPPQTHIPATTLIAIPETTPVVEPPKEKIRLRFHERTDTAVLPELFIDSKYARIDPATGFLLLSLPDNAPVQHYSLKIFDDRNKLIWQVPLLREPRILMDKRNFQKRGTYQFILFKNGFEMDTGNFVIR